MSLASRFRLYKSLVTSIPLYCCETWTQLADSEESVQAFKTKCMRTFVHNSYFEHKTSDWVQSKINFLVGPQEPLLAIVKRWNFSWFWHVTRHSSLSKTILHRALQGGQCCGLQRNCWMDNMKEWTSLPIPELLTRAACRKGWKRISAESSLMSPPPPLPITQSVKGLH